MPAVNTAENANKKPDAQHRSRKTGVDRKQYRKSCHDLRDHGNRLRDQSDNRSYHNVNITCQPV